jgi:hypothetical protein
MEKSDRLLVLETRDSPDWDFAIKIFEDRVEGRFLKQIDLLEKNPNRLIRVFAGFAIMSLDCLLIETLEQFYKGNIRTGAGMDEKAFFDFFQRSLKFKSFFDTQAKATVFYQQIRCGLLHQAQTKKKSTIHILPEEMLQWVNPKCLNEGIRIQRKLFHAEVVGIYTSYVDKLKDQKELNLKRKFRRKMNYIVNQK